MDYILKDVPRVTSGWPDFTLDPAASTCTASSISGARTGGPVAVRGFERNWTIEDNWLGLPAQTLFIHDVEYSFPYAEEVWTEFSIFGCDCVGWKNIMEGADEFTIVDKTSYQHKHHKQINENEILISFHDFEGVGTPGDLITSPFNFEGMHSFYQTTILTDYTALSMNQNQCEGILPKLEAMFNDDNIPADYRALAYLQEVGRYLSSDAVDEDSSLTGPLDGFNTVLPPHDSATPQGRPLSPGEWHEDPMSYFKNGGAEGDIYTGRPYWPKARIGFYGDYPVSGKDWPASNLTPDITLAPTKVPTMYGDPHLTGFHGQRFDLVGKAGKQYLLLADDRFQIGVEIDRPFFQHSSDTGKGARPVVHRQGERVKEHVPLYMAGVHIAILDGEGQAHSVSVQGDFNSTLKKHSSFCKGSMNAEPTAECLRGLKVVLNGQEPMKHAADLELGLGLALQMQNTICPFDKRQGVCGSFHKQTGGYAMVTLTSPSIHLDVGAQWFNNHEVGHRALHHLDLDVSAYRPSGPPRGLLGQTVELKYDKAGLPIMEGPACIGNEDSFIIDKVRPSQLRDSPRDAPVAAPLFASVDGDAAAAAGPSALQGRRLLNTHRSLANADDVNDGVGLGVEDCVSGDYRGPCKTLDPDLDQNNQLIGRHAVGTTRQQRWAIHQNWTGTTTFQKLAKQDELPPAYACIDYTPYERRLNAEYWVNEGGRTSVYKDNYQYPFQMSDERNCKDSWSPYEVSESCEFQKRVLYPAGWTMHVPEDLNNDGYEATRWEDPDWCWGCQHNVISCDWFYGHADTRSLRWQEGTYNRVSNGYADDEYGNLAPVFLPAPDDFICPELGTFGTDANDPSSCNMGTARCVKYGGRHEGHPYQNSFGVKTALEACCACGGGNSTVCSVNGTAAVDLFGNGPTMESRDQTGVLVPLCGGAVQSSRARGLLATAALCFAIVALG
jgi:hypothetical protein